MQVSSPRRRRLLELGGASATLLAAPWLLPQRSAHAQLQPSGDPHWPTRPLRIVVGFGGGSSPDMVARTIAEPLAQALGQPVVVDNRPGASGNIAASMVAKATDQHTIGMLINGNMTIAKVLQPSTPYDPQKDLAPVSLICTAPLVLTVPMGGPVRDGRSFLAAARAAGDAWSYGSPGIGTLGHLGMEVFKSQAGIGAMHVPYQGNPQVIGALIAGQLQLALLPPGLAEAQVSSGKLRALGVTSAARSALVPDYPTLQEAGLPSVGLEIWTAAAAPAGLPAPIRQRLATLISQITRTPEVRQKLFAHGYGAVGSTPEELAQQVRGDTVLLSRIIESQHIRLE